MKNNKRIPLSILTPYGMLMLPLSAAGLPLALYLAPFYTDNMGMSFTTVGLALMLSRLIDIFFDPMIGRLSDKTNSRFGRRRPWIMAGVPLMMLSVWQVFDPPAAVSGLWLFIWLALIYMSLTIIMLPYYAWGAELSDDYNERSRVSGVRETWSAVGVLAAFVAPYFFMDLSLYKDMTFVERSIAETQYSVNFLGYAAIILLPICALILFVSVKERKAQGGGGAHGQWLKLLSLRPLQLLLATQLISGLAFGINLTTAVYYFRYRIQIPTEDASGMFVAYFAMAVVGAFLWMYIVQKFGKRRSLIAATILNAVCMGLLAVIEPKDFYGAFALQIVTGLVYEGPLIIGASMLADIIELDLLKTRLQRSAAFFAIWLIGRKFTEAAGAGIALPLLENLGYNAETAMTDQGQTALIIVNSLIPCALGLLAVVPLLAYPINGKVQKRVRAAIERRKLRDMRVSGEGIPVTY